MMKEEPCKKKRDRYEMLEDFIAAYDYLKEHPNCNGKIGVVGFCFGGWISNMMAVKIKTLLAAVPFLWRTTFCQRHSTY